MKPKILVVDDNAVVQKSLQLKLGTAGFKVLTAVDGAAALGAIRRHTPDLIILDITFPPDVPHGGGVAWNAFLLMQWLRQTDETRDIPVIIITGGDPEAFRDRAFSEGAIAFFTKPIDHKGLIDVIHQTLQPPATPT
jgi:CheY-like chemotaxis protein